MTRAAFISTILLLPVIRKPAAVPKEVIALSDAGTKAIHRIILSDASFKISGSDLVATIKARKAGKALADLEKATNGLIDSHR